MASLLSKIIIPIIRLTGNVNPGNTKNKKAELIKNMRSIEKVFKIYLPPAGYKLDRYDVNGLPVELFHKKKGGSDKLVFVMHGGAYISHMAFIYRWMNLAYSRASGGGSVLHIDYRCAPEYKYPCALEDALKAWNWALERGFKEENTVTVGDSAGGHLNISLMMKLNSMGKKQPKGAVFMSPWLDMTTSGSSYLKNYRLDPVFGEKKSAPTEQDVINLRSSELYCWYGAADPENPFISPIYAEFDDTYPTSYITAGGNEMLLSDSRALFEKLKKAGVDVRLDITPGMFHDFVIYQIMPESSRAVKAVCRFIGECLDTPNGSHRGRDY